MGQTKVMAYFNIKGDDFPLEIVTELLGITPTNTMKKGALRDSNFPEYPYRFTSWSYGTDYVETLDVGNQLLPVLNEFRDKIDIINEIQSTYNVTCIIVIVPEIYDGRAPGIVFDKDTIEFAYRVNASIEIDLYAMPYADTEIGYGFG